MTDCERIVAECADTIGDIASKDTPLDWEPFDNQQYEKIKLAIKDAIQAAVESLVAEMEAWAE